MLLLQDWMKSELLFRLAMAVKAKCQQGLNITGFNQFKENMKGRRCERSSKTFALLLVLCYFQLYASTSSKIHEQGWFCFYKQFIKKENMQIFKLYFLVV